MLKSPHCFPPLQQQHKKLDIQTKIFLPQRTEVTEQTASPQTGERQMDTENHSYYNREQKPRSKIQQLEPVWSQYQ